MDFYTKTSVKFFGPIVERYLDYFEDLKLDLKRAKLGLTLKEYLSLAVMTSFLVFVFEMPAIALILALLRLGFLFSFATAITLSITLPLLFFLLFLKYPKLLVADKVKNIEDNLPFATTYLATISSSNLPPAEMFKIFSKMKEFGEVAREAKNIVVDTDMFGLDINAAIDRAAERTPSKAFKDVLTGISNILRSGGDLAGFLKQKTDMLMEEYRKKLYEFSHTLTIFMEVYLTALIVGTLFFVIITSVMSGLAFAQSPAATVTLQFLIIFIVVPLISLAFIVLIKSMSPGGD